MYINNEKQIYVLSIKFFFELHTVITCILKARQAGIEMFAIGVGRGVDIPELISIAGNQSRVYYADDYNRLQNIEYDFVKSTRATVGPCQEPTTTPSLIRELAFHLCAIRY